MQDLEAIDLQLKKDQQLCQEQRLPSTLALRLPKPPSPLLDKIAYHLTPEREVHAALPSFRCESIIKGIISYLNNLNAVADETSDALLSEETHTPKTEELETALKVLEYLQNGESAPSITASSSLTDTMTSLRTQLSVDSEVRIKYYKTTQKGQKFNKNAQSRNCYMCRQLCSIFDVHDLYPSLCRPCGSFNLSSSELSLPGKLNLDGKTALVTGGRINLGYHTALRLLRCGAKVMISSRYPRDAATRYLQEPDCEQWEHKFKVIGADFRTAKDAFRLVHIVKALLRDWNESDRNGSADADSLDILINNAAQTLTDPVKAEMKAISREEDLVHLLQTNKLLIDGVGDSYILRIRGGNQAAWIPRIESEKRPLISDGTGNGDQNKIIHKGLRNSGEKDTGRSSWVQSLNEIPYEDLISAHSVNAFVPLILCRELLPCMGQHRPGERTPMGYIVNVSSREGILENTNKSSSKAGHHVHTNMSKAAINMITETEAGRAWEMYRVAMNSVDPGYMSAAPECRQEDGCPIDFEDGAARVLWPIVVGEREGRVISGRFLKYFEEGAAIIRRGNQ
ncbi:hypothetical protein N7486_006536 [Penicillium sp. IBT 16267x]|nr:hypothetical protein N7486_006536 [Penicillium sp. IBT 16267x]